MLPHPSPTPTPQKTSGVGNHEQLWPNSSSWAAYGAATDSGGECGVTTQTLLPMAAPATSAKPYYTYSAGPVFLVILSTEQDFTTGSEQNNWLEGVLAGVDRDVTPWLIVSMHRMMYVDSNFGGTPTSDVVVMNLLQQHVEPVLHRHSACWGYA